MEAKVLALERPPELKSQLCIYLSKFRYIASPFYALIFLQREGGG